MPTAISKFDLWGLPLSIHYSRSIFMHDLCLSRLRMEPLKSIVAMCKMTCSNFTSSVSMTFMTFLEWLSDHVMRFNGMYAMTEGNSLLSHSIHDKSDNRLSNCYDSLWSNQILNSFMTQHQAQNRLFSQNFWALIAIVNTMSLSVVPLQVR